MVSPTCSDCFFQWLNPLQARFLTEYLPLESPPVTEPCWEPHGGADPGEKPVGNTKRDLGQVSDLGNSRAALRRGRWDGGLADTSQPQLLFSKGPLRSAVCISPSSASACCYGAAPALPLFLPHAGSCAHTHSGTGEVSLGSPSSPSLCTALAQLSHSSVPEGLTLLKSH